MRNYQTIIFTSLLIFSISACNFSATQQAVFTPAFFYLSFDPKPGLLISDTHKTAARKRIPLDPPSDCSLFALHPAPIGRWVAVEWECAFGPTVELFDTASGESHFALSNPAIDSRFLAWQPDGLALYLKIGTLSFPQTLQVDAASGQAVELPISPFTYDLTSAPDGKRILFSVTKGPGFGSEIWLAGPDGQNPSQLLVEAAHIITLALYSPDGSQIAYIKLPDAEDTSQAGELWLMDSNGFKSRLLANASARQGLSMAWAPSGDKIAFSSLKEAGNTEVPILALYDLRLDQVIPGPDVPGRLPTWSPDGRLITFSSADPISAAGVDSSVSIYEISSGQLTQLADSACCAGWLR